MVSGQLLGRISKVSGNFQNRVRANGKCVWEELLPNI
jgi:hypothetical protein